jgi:hypothetical protein
MQERIDAVHATGRQCNRNPARNSTRNAARKWRVDHGDSNGG